MARILIIEDESPMADAVKFSFEKEGLEVDIASDGEEGLRLFEDSAYDLIILDLMLPGVDGLEICRKVRQAGETPVIMLTAKDSETDRVLGLEMGADDYVTKPFSMRELLARARAVLRRAHTPSHEKDPLLLDGGGITVDTERHEVTVRGRVVEVPLTEYRLLELFLKNKGKVLSREYLIAAGWAGEFYGQSKGLDVHIRRLRQRIEEDPASPSYVVTVRGVGYRFEPH